MGNEKTLQLKVDLTGDHIEWFNAIQKQYNFQTNVEVIRFAIYNTYEILKRNETIPSIELDPDQVEIIDKLIGSKVIKQQFNIYNTRQFVEVAITELINHIRETRRSILEWDVKTTLSGEKQEIAIAFSKCYHKSASKGVTIEDLSIQLGWRDRDKIEEIMDSFVDQFIVKVAIVDDKKLYHV